MLTSSIKVEDFSLENAAEEMKRLLQDEVILEIFQEAYIMKSKYMALDRIAETVKNRAIMYCPIDTGVSVDSIKASVDYNTGDVSVTFDSSKHKVNISNVVGWSDRKRRHENRAPVGIGIESRLKELSLGLPAGSVGGDFIERAWEDSSDEIVVILVESGMA